MKFKSVVFTCLILIAVMARTSFGVAEGQPLPEVSITDIADGSLLNLSDYHGKVLLIDFWASWCEPCAKSFPFFEALYEAYRVQGLEVVAVSLDFESSDVEQFLTDHEVSFTIGWDPKGQLANVFKVPGMPTSYLVGRDGVVKIIHKGFSHSDKKHIEQHILDLLGL